MLGLKKITIFNDHGIFTRILELVMNQGKNCSHVKLFQSTKVNFYTDNSLKYLLVISPNGVETSPFHACFIDMLQLWNVARVPPLHVTSSGCLRYLCTYIRIIITYVHVRRRPAIIITAPARNFDIYHTANPVQHVAELESLKWCKKKNLVERLVY